MYYYRDFKSLQKAFFIQLSSKYILEKPQSFFRDNFATLVKTLVILGTY